MTFTSPNRSTCWRRVIAVMMLCAMSAANGCAQPKGVIFEPREKAIFWPPPPDPARIHYVGAIVTDLDLKPAKSFGKAVGEALFGKDPARSMLSPYAICTDQRDRLFVCDSNAQLVHVFNMETREYQQWRPTGTGRHFAQPVGIAFDENAGDGRLFVSDSVAGMIFVFDDTGTLIDEIAHDHLTRPCGIAIDSYRQRLFVADAAKHQIIVLDLNGELIAEIGTRGTALGEFNFPTNVALDSAGRLFVSDSLNFRVQMFDADLTPLRQIGRQGDMPGYFSNPKGVALDSEHHLYVIDAHFEAVQIFDIDGRLLMSFGEEGRGPGQFWLPSGIHIDRHDRIWIADPYNRRVQVFDYRPEVTP